MTTNLQDRTISMILTIPYVKELTRTVEDLDSLSQNNSKPPPSIPIYHGSIINIEPHQDDQNISDLIVRIPDFHHMSIPSVTISINDETPQTKRRAPICPIINETYKTNESENMNHAKRLALGLRNLRRAIITNCKIKRPTNINQINIVPVLPDVEIIRENFQPPISEKKRNKNSNSTSKHFRPKILFIKRKKFHMNKKRPTSANSVDTQTDCEENRTNENSQDEEKKIDYSFINPDNKELPNAETSDNDFLPKTFISNARIDLITGHRDNDDLKGEVFIVNPNDDTYSECYEVAYEFDPEFQRYKEQIYLPEVQDLPSEITPWISTFPRNDYEQLDQTQSGHSYSSTQENNPSMINEDYNVILQFLKHALEIESIPDNDCNEFNKQIKELFRTE